jgi:NADPH-dependent 2,4-dienoyl-CoA reductase/sulfur reductase-like enzyme
VVIVGGGVLGVMHALEARRLGCQVAMFSVVRREGDQP